MADDRTRRFARLRPQPPAERGSGDLFAHFGIAEDPQTEWTAPAQSTLAPPATEHPTTERPATEHYRTQAPTVPQAPAMVLPCSDCGWFRATPWVEPCPNCAAPARLEPDPQPKRDDH